MCCLSLLFDTDLSTPPIFVIFLRIRRIGLKSSESPPKLGGFSQTMIFFLRRGPNGAIYGWRKIEMNINLSFDHVLEFKLSMISICKCLMSSNYSIKKSYPPIFEFLEVKTTII